MNTYFTVFIAITLSVTLFYVLKHYGLATQKMRSAVLYIGGANVFRRRYKARFVSCSGYEKTQLWFKESGRYQFHYQSFIEKGAVSVEMIADKQNHQFTLSKDEEMHSIYVEANCKYELVIRYTKASGRFELTW